MVCEDRGAPVSHAAAILAPAEVDALMGVRMHWDRRRQGPGRQRLMPGTSSLSVISYVIGKPQTLMGFGAFDWTGGLVHRPGFVLMVKGAGRPRPRRYSQMVMPSSASVASALLNA